MKTMNHIITKLQAFIFGRDKTKTAFSAKDAATQKQQADPVKKHEDAAAISNSLTNPYVLGAEGRKEWNDRYMNMAAAIRNWQLAFAAVAVLALVELIVIANIATQSKIKPYVVETNQGVPYAIKPVGGISDKDQRLVNFAVNQFVINAKTVIADTAAEKSLLDKLYAYSAGSTFSFLQDFYAKNNPFELASQYTVSVNIINSLPISEHTWQVIWEETKRHTAEGSLVSTTRWVGQFTYEFGEVNAKHINDNPFGIYITAVTWSQSQNQQ